MFKKPINENNLTLKHLCRHLWIPSPPIYTLSLSLSLSLSLPHPKHLIFLDYIGIRSLLRYFARTEWHSKPEVLGSGRKWTRTMYNINIMAPKHFH